MRRLTVIRALLSLLALPLRARAGESTLSRGLELGKTALVFSVLIAAGIIVSRGLERNWQLENPTDVEAIARKTAENIKSELRTAKAGSIAISHKQGNPPNTLLRFFKTDGTEVAYFEDMRSLYREHNQRAEKIIDGDLLAAYFTRREDRRLFMEFQVWARDQSGELTIRTVPTYVDTKGSIIQSSRRPNWKRRKVGVTKR